MSIVRCHDCERAVDTDFEETCSVEIGNQRRQHKVIEICQPCYIKRENEGEMEP